MWVSLLCNLYLWKAVVKFTMAFGKRVAMRIESSETSGTCAGT
jgi:hypothetical protein